MADQFPDVAVGDAVFEILVMPFKASANIAKGAVVALTHVAADMPTIATAATGSITVIGVAMEAITSGNVGKVLVVGVIKVTADATTGVTAGKLIAPGAVTSGAVQDLATAGSVIGRAIQTMAVGETGLVAINCLH